MKYEVDINEVKKPDPCKEVKLSCSSIVKLAITLSISLTFTISITYSYRTEINVFFSGIGCSGKGTEQSDSDAKKFFYDTNLEYSVYIKGDLGAKELHVFDQVLEYEKFTCGLELEKLKVKEMSFEDQRIIEAYGRWRRIKEFYRSNGRVVYPSERSLYQ